MTSYWLKTRVVFAGAQNQRWVSAAFNDFFYTYRLWKHVCFATHKMVHRWTPSSQSLCLNLLDVSACFFCKYSRLCISSSPKIFSFFEMRKTAGPNPLYPLEVREHWLISQFVLNCSAHNTPIPNLFLVGLISA